MTVLVKKAPEIGFCYGVQRAIAILEKEVKEHGSLNTLGAVVHNEQVLRRLSAIGITIANNLDEITSDVVAISSHGISPAIEARLRGRRVRVLDTTCPFVRRAQIAARRLAESSFFTVVFGEAQHPEVEGILGWAKGRGLATLDTKHFTALKKLPRRLGILAQTTQIPDSFTKFVKEMIDLTLLKDSEIRIIDTICHDIRKRQSVSLELAGKVDLMLVIGGHSSANTKRLWELCSAVIATYLIGSAEEIDLAWLKGKHKIGITSGTSTSEITIDEVIERIKAAGRS